MSPRTRRPSRALLITGAVAVTAAAVVVVAVPPMITKLPTDTDTTVHYNGTATLLNSAALSSGDLAHAVTKDIPVTVDRHIFVRGTDGDAALVHFDNTMTVPGQPPTTDNHLYRVDRKTDEGLGGGSGVQTEPASGLIFTAPVYPKRADYTIYDPGTAVPTPLKYLGTSTVSGREVYNYHATAKGALRSAGTLATLPKALPKALVGALLPLLPADSRQALSTALPTMADPIPLSYASDTEIGFGADATLGTPLDGEIDQTVSASVSGNGNDIPLLPVLDIRTKMTDASTADAVNTATTRARTLNLITVVLPISLVALGVVCWSIVFVRRRPFAPADRKVSR